MRVTITARHCELSDGIRKRANELMQKLGRFDPNVSHAEVVFEAERKVKRVEGIVSLDGSDPMVAKAEDDDEFGPALELMADRLAKQVRRRRAREREHKATGLGKVPTSAPD